MHRFKQLLGQIAYTPISISDYIHHVDQFPQQLRIMAPVEGQNTIDKKQKYPE